MKVIEVMRDYKKKGVSGCWIMEQNGFEYLYGMYGHSSIENNDYIEQNKRVFNSTVLEVQTINKETIRIIYK